MEKTTKRIILAFIVGIITLYCSVYGFILYDSHIKGVKGNAYEIKIQNDYLMFLGDMSSSIKLEDITSIQFYEKTLSPRGAVGRRVRRSGTSQSHLRRARRHEHRQHDLQNGRRERYAQLRSPPAGGFLL